MIREACYWRRTQVSQEASISDPMPSVSTGPRACAASAGHVTQPRRSRVDQLSGSHLLPESGFPVRRSGDSWSRPPSRMRRRCRGSPVAGPQPRARNGSKSVRWKLVGNAVTTGVAAWLGRRLADPGSYDPTKATPLLAGEQVAAARGAARCAVEVHVSMWPEQHSYTHLLNLLDDQNLTPLSYRAAAGFLERTQRAKLRFDSDFILAVKNHVSANGARADKFRDIQRDDI